VKRDLLFLVVICFWGQILLSQGIPVGQWRSHLPLNETHSIAILGDEIIAASSYGLLRYDLVGDVLSDFTKVDGLGGIGITAIKASPNSKELLIGYEDGLLELWSENNIIQIPDIFASGRYPGKSRINSISFDGENKAFVATGFGVVELDLIYGVVKGTYILSQDGTTIETFDIEVDSDSLFVSSERGFWSASLADPLYLFSNWKQDQRWIDTIINEISVSENSRLISTKQDESVWFRSNGAWSKINLNNSTGNKIKSIRKQENGYVISRDFDVVITNELCVQKQTYSSAMGNNDNFKPLDATIHENGTIWIANSSKGLTFIDNLDYAQHRTITSPPYSSVFDLDYSDHGIDVFSGAIDPTWTASYCNQGVFTFRDENWSVLNSLELNQAKDILSKVINPNDTSHWFVSSWGKGVLEFKNGMLDSIWNSNNSTLLDALGSVPGDVRVGGMLWGNDDALWVTNALSNKPLHRYDPQTKSWKSYGLGPFNGLSIKQINQSNDDVFWIQSRTDGLLAVSIDEDNSSFRRLTTGINNGNLPSSSVNSFVFERDNELWIGTIDGLVVCFNPYDAISGVNIDAQALLVEENGIVQKVLSGENILSMAVDGANRKWIGTADGGLFLLSPDGLKTIAHFTKSNSPIFSNRVNSLAIDDKSGEVFIGTSRGLVSYRSNAIEPFLNLNNIHVFPNPYEPKHFGPISLKGLTEDSYVKVTNSSGRLVFEGQATGGQFSWTTNGLNDTPVPSGIYLFWITNPLGTETKVVQGVIIRGE